LESNGISVGVDEVAAWFKQHLASQATSTAGAYPVKVSNDSTKKVATQVLPLSPAPAKHEGGSPKYWIVPSGKQGGHSAEEHLRSWLDRGFWGFGPSTPGRKAMRPGDWACFYASVTHQILALGRIAGDLDHLVEAQEWPGPGPFHGEVYKVPLADVTWLDPAPVLDAELRAQLDAFRDKVPGAGWSWLVQSTRKVTAGDFMRLTGQEHS